jgi:hypothetical protein
MATATTTASTLPRLLKTHEALILTDWMREQRAVGGRVGTLTDADLESESRHFLALLPEKLATIFEPFVQVDHHLNPRQVRDWGSASRSAAISCAA